ncbi:MAG: VOC family protein, partial [Actinomycetota bacterium]
MQVRFVAGFGPIVREMDASLHFYREVLGLPLVQTDDISTNKLEGVKYFSLWPLADTPESCFGAREWPSNRLLVAPKTEPWGQTVARL